jgi:PleD family two-component response regulator
MKYRRSDRQGFDLIVCAGAYKGTGAILAVLGMDIEARTWNWMLARVEVGRRMVEMQAALIESREALAHHASHDPLMGLLNRRAILVHLHKELARAGRRKQDYD